MWFWFVFPWWLVTLSIFSCSYWPLVCFLWRNVNSDPLPNFSLDCSSFYYWVVRAIYIFRYKSLIRFMICKYFPSSCGLSSHFLGSVLWNIKVFNFDEVQIICFSFDCLCSHVISKDQILFKTRFFSACVSQSQAFSSFPF